MQRHILSCNADNKQSAYNLLKKVGIETTIYFTNKCVADHFALICQRKGMVTRSHAGSLNWHWRDIKDPVKRRASLFGERKGNGRYGVTVKQPFSLTVTP